MKEDREILINLVKQEVLEATKDFINLKVDDETTTKLEQTVAYVVGNFIEKHGLRVGDIPNFKVVSSEDRYDIIPIETGNFKNYNSPFNLPIKPLSLGRVMHRDGSESTYKMPGIDVTSSHVGSFSPEFIKKDVDVYGTTDYSIEDLLPDQMGSERLLLEENRVIEEITKETLDICKHIYSDVSIQELATVVDAIAKTVANKFFELHKLHKDDIIVYAGVHEETKKITVHFGPITTHVLKKIISSKRLLKYNSDQRK